MRERETAYEICDDVTDWRSQIQNSFVKGGVLGQGGIEALHAKAQSSIPIIAWGSLPGMDQVQAVLGLNRIKVPSLKVQ